MALDGTHEIHYYVKVANHPNIVPNPDGGNVLAENFNTQLGLNWNFESNGIPVQSVSIAKIYGPSSLSVNPGYNGDLSTIGGVATTTQSSRMFTGSLGVGESALARITVTVGPTNYTNTNWFNTRTDFTAAGIYQVLPSSMQDTVSNPYYQCHCYGLGVRLRSQSNISLSKSVVSSACVAGQNNVEEVTYDLTVSAPSTNNVWVRNLGLIDSLSAQSCGSFIGIVGTPTITSSTATTNPTINSAYNGTSNINLFSGSFNDRLGPGQQIVVRVRARYNIGQMCSPNQFNSARAIGTHPAGLASQFITSNINVPRVTGCCLIAVSLGAAVNICQGGSLTLSPTVTDGTPTYSYSWSGSLGSGSSVSVNPASTTTYTVTVTDASSCSSSSTRSVSVIADPTVSISGNTNVCTGGSVTLTANVSGGSGTNSFQWQRRISPSGAWTNVGTNSASYATDATLTANSYDYQVIITQTGIGCGNTSIVANANVISDPVVNITSTAGTLCVGASTTLNATSSGGTGTCNFQWQNNTGSGWNNITGATSAAYTTPALSVPTNYRALIICSGAGCCE